MNEPVAARESDPTAHLRWTIYLLLIAISTGSIVGRIMAVNSVDRVALENYLVQKEVAKQTKERTERRETFVAAELEGQIRQKLRKQRPFLSANDRSRWATVRSLVEHGTYEIDQVVAEELWDTIDIVQHRGWDGELHLYSSKPPLLATILAGEYWLIHKATGATLATHPYEIGRFMLVTLNGLPLVVYFVLLARLAERFGTTNWGRIFMVAAGAFGTFLSTFAVALNNHLLAAVVVAVALWAAVRIWYDGERRWPWFAITGFFAAFAYSVELPCLSFFVLLTAGLLWRAPRETLLAYVPAALVVIAAHLGTNYIAHGTVREPYAHRSQTDPADNWYKFIYTKSDGKTQKSYWSDPKGIDRGEPSAAAYALHATVGHHGILSLTPMWLLTQLGFVLAWRQNRMRELVALTVILTAACLAFYLLRPMQIDRNYGGMTSGLRWMFWFAPLWLVCLLPAADRLSSSRLGRGVCLVLLGFSVLSVSYPTWNPWTHPWITNFLLDQKWIQF